MLEMLYYVKKGVFSKEEAKLIIKNRENHGIVKYKKNMH